MDDRRHRLLGLDKVAKGSVGMHGLKEWGQQFLNTADGMFMTGNKEKKMRFALVENSNGKHSKAVARVVAAVVRQPRSSPLAVEVAVAVARAAAKSRRKVGQKRYISEIGSLHRAN